MNNMEIVVHIKNVYGTDKVYPACKKAHLFTDIAGTTTLRPSDLKAIQDLGYSIRVTQRHIEELTNVR